MMKRLPLIAMLIILALAAVACGGGPTGGPGAAEEPAAGGETTSGEPQLDAELSVFNWEDYIDEQVLRDYEERYGVTIVYDTFASNEDLLAKLQAGAAGYDVIFPSDYMVAQMIELGLLAEIDVASMPNFANIGEEFKDPPYDPGNRFCTPYQWGMTGIGYRNGQFEQPPDSWAYLFETALLEQNAPDGINVLDDQRELMAAALFYLGYSPNTTDRAQLEEARDLILAAKPFWKTFNSSDYYSTLMVSDEIVLSHAWSGDTAQAFWETFDEETGEGNWLFTVPVEGAVRYQDNVCIPASSTRQATAQHFMNYLMEAEVAAAITNFTFYPSPNEAAREFIDPEILNNPGIYPPEEVRAKLQWLEDVGDAVFIYDEMWTAIKGQ
jgi:spermidine/putrescine-binding protein